VFYSYSYYKKLILSVARRTAEYERVIVKKTVALDASQNDTNAQSKKKPIPTDVLQRLDHITTYGRCLS